MNCEIHEKAESCPSCRAAGKNLITQIPSTEKNNLDILTKPNQEIQLDFAGPIKSETRGDVYILVAIDRFSKWPTAHICKSADTRTVKKFLTKYFTDNGIPRVIRTDNGSCFKSIEFKQFCKDKILNVYGALQTYIPAPVWSNELSGRLNHLHEQTWQTA